MLSTLRIYFVTTSMVRDGSLWRDWGRGGGSTIVAPSSPSPQKPLFLPRLLPAGSPALPPASIPAPSLSLSDLPFGGECDLHVGGNVVGLLALKNGKEGHRLDRAEGSGMAGDVIAEPATDEHRTVRLGEALNPALPAVPLGGGSSGGGD